MANEIVVYKLYCVLYLVIHFYFCSCFQHESQQRYTRNDDIVDQINELRAALLLLLLHGYCNAPNINGIMESKRWIVFFGGHPELYSHHMLCMQRASVSVRACFITRGRVPNAYLHVYFFINVYTCKVLCVVFFFLTGRTAAVDIRLSSFSRWCCSSGRQAKPNRRQGHWHWKTGDESTSHVSCPSLSQGIISNIIINSSSSSSWRRRRSWFSNGNHWSVSSATRAAFMKSRTPRDTNAIRCCSGWMVYVCAINQSR